MTLPFLEDEGDCPQSGVGDARGQQRPSRGLQRASRSLSSRFTLDGGWQRGTVIPGLPRTASLRPHSSSPSQTWQDKGPYWAAVRQPCKAPARSQSSPLTRRKGLSQKLFLGAGRAGYSALAPGPGADLLLEQKLLLSGCGGTQGPSQCTSCFLGKVTCSFQSVKPLGSRQTCVVRADV